MHGSIKETKLTDELGSTESVEKKYHADILSKPVRKYFEIKHKVSSQEEELEQYKIFSDDIKTDKRKLDPEWRLEYPQTGREQGYYIVVVGYTLLEY